MTEYTFDEVSNGEWVKGSDYVGKWILIRFKEIGTRDGMYGEQTVMTCDWADLSAKTPEMLMDVQNSDAYVAGKFKGKKPGALVVGRIKQGEPPQKGWNGPIYLETPTGDKAYAAAQKKAVALLKKLEAEEPAKPAVEAETDELDELLMEDE